MTTFAPQPTTQLPTLPATLPALQIPPSADPTALFDTAGLLTLWNHQLGEREEITGLFGPPGWLLEASLAPLLAGVASALPEFAGDHLPITGIDHGCARLLLERLPTTVLDCDAPCSPTTRTLLEVATRHRGTRVHGHVVGPDRVDERVTVDGITIAEPPEDPLGLLSILQLYSEYDWEAEVDLPPDPISAPPSEASHALEEQARLALHSTAALAPLWPIAVERYGLTGARHAPDEITIERARRGTSTYGVRFWWRWGTSRLECPTAYGGSPGTYTLAELTRQLAA